MNPGPRQNTVRLVLKRLSEVARRFELAERFRESFAYRTPEDRRKWQDFARYRRNFGKVLSYRLNSKAGTEKHALVCGTGYPLIEAELGFVKTLELAGLSPVILSYRDASLDRKYYELAGDRVIFWEDFAEDLDTTRAQALLADCSSVQELMNTRYEGARVGLIAVSTMRRWHRLGAIDLHSRVERENLIKALANAIRYAQASQRLIKSIRPQLALFVDGVYTPEAELVDICLAYGIRAISWNVAHRNNTVMLKRYIPGVKACGLNSLSDKSWEKLLELQWTPEHRERLTREIYDSYVKGDWYGDCGTQFNKRLFAPGELRAHLGLDPRKRTAFIFPHILWDESFDQGVDLFRDYEEWLVETVRAACKNERVNWVIKIHPAHVGKATKEGFEGDPAEVVALRKHIGRLPPHVHFVPADTIINTLSLFEIMDYCVTVRGTVGIEAARLGIPVLTAGTGRYDRRGFTLDSETREQFLYRISHIQDISRLTATEQELAERFAYGLFVLRPLELTTITLEYGDTQNFRGKYRINVKSRADWYNAADLETFVRWLTLSNDEDFLTSFAES